MQTHAKPVKFIRQKQELFLLSLRFFNLEFFTCKLQLHLPEPAGLQVQHPSRQQPAQPHIAGKADGAAALAFCPEQPPGF